MASNTFSRNEGDSDIVENRPPTFAIVNCKTGKQLSIADGSVVTSDQDPFSDSHSHWAFSNAPSTEEAQQLSYTITNGATGEILTQGHEQCVQLGPEESKESTVQWKLIPQQENAHVFLIANEQSGICLKEAHLGPETAAISTDAVPATFVERDSPLFWEFVAVKDEDKEDAKLIDVKSMTTKKYPARDAMLYLIGQWQEITAPKHWTKKNIALIEFGEGPRGQKPFDRSLCGGNVRIDMQSWTSTSKEHPHSCANVQGQVQKKSVFQVNIDPEVEWGVEAIKAELIRSMDNVEKRWMHAPMRR